MKYVSGKLDLYRLIMFLFLMVGAFAIWFGWWTPGLKSFEFLVLFCLALGFSKL